MNRNILRLAVIGIVVVGLFVAGGCLGADGDGPSETDTTTVPSETDTTTVETTESETGDITGSVVDPNLEEPIAAATVSLNGEEVETDDDGAFEFSDVSAGEYELRVSKENYTTEELSITVSGDQSVEVPLKNDKFYKPAETELGATHISNEESCTSCHEGAETATEINSETSEDSCMSCHSTADVKNSTADLTHNPHDDPHGYSENCGSCHKIHTESVNMCAQCHEEGFVPEPP